MIDGTYGFVYSGVNGRGVGIFTVVFRLSWLQDDPNRVIFCAFS